MQLLILVVFAFIRFCVCITELIFLVGCLVEENAVEQMALMLKLAKRKMIGGEQSNIFGAVYLIYF